MTDFCRILPVLLGNGQSAYFSRLEADIKNARAKPTHRFRRDGSMIDKGTQLGPYEIERFLGRNAMGEVYSAQDTRIERSVAINVIGEGLLASDEHNARFEREARNTVVYEPRADPRH
jgi:serine/threonine protein kinase